MVGRISSNFYFPFCTFLLKAENFKIQVRTRREIFKKNICVPSTQRFEIPPKVYYSNLEQIIFI